MREYDRYETSKNDDIDDELRQTDPFVDASGYDPANHFWTPHAESITDPDDDDLDIDEAAVRQNEEAFGRENREDFDQGEEVSFHKAA